MKFNHSIIDSYGKEEENGRHQPARRAESETGDPESVHRIAGTGIAFHCLILIGSVTNGDGTGN